MAIPHPLACPPTAKPQPAPEPPPLEAGARLTATEFMRRYEAMPHVKKAELIEGVVHMPSPVSASRHGDPHTAVIFWLTNYEFGTPGLIASDNSTCLLDADNVPQPDAHLRIVAGGATQLNERGYVVGAPELAVEISATTTQQDRQAKFTAYSRSGVREYIIWRTRDRAVDWFVLREGRYELLPPDEQGLLRSSVFPGLWLDPAALVDRDLPRLMAALRAGLATPEHAAFVERIRGNA